jgi:hypothetical protein
MALAAFLCVAGCAGARHPRVVSLPEASVRAATHIDSITDDGVAIATIASVIERDLGVGPLPVTLHYYPDTRAFEAALLNLGYEATFARTFARNVRAAGGYRRVLLNEGALAQVPRRVRVRVLAHELTHSLEYELGGGSRGTSDQWIREGFAEWLAVYVVDRLRGRPMGDVRMQKLDEFRRSNTSRAPRLVDMASSSGWVALTGRRDIAPYAQAFLAVDALIAQRGVEAMMQYFRSFTQSPDRDANFRSAFGIELSAFNASLDARLRIRRANAAASR